LPEPEYSSGSTRTKEILEMPETTLFAAIDATDGVRGRMLIVQRVILSEEASSDDAEKIILEKYPEAKVKGWFTTFVASHGGPNDIRL